MTCQCDHCLYHRSRLSRVLAWAPAWELDMGLRISVIKPSVDAGPLSVLLPSIQQWEGLQNRMGATFHMLAQGA